MNPDVKFILEAFFESPMALTAEGDLLLEIKKKLVSQEQNVGSCESDGLCLVKNQSRVLRLKFLFGNPWSVQGNSNI